MILLEAVKTSPLTCGDSESPVSLDSEVMIRDVTEDIKEETVQTEFPVPFTKETNIVDGNGVVYLMHERCKKSCNNFPLVSYMVPVRVEQRILRPSALTIRVSKEKVFEIKGISNILSKR